ECVPSVLSAIVDQNTPWSEFKYHQDTKVFGEAEPADYVYQIRDGAVRAYKRLLDGRRQISAFHLPGDLFGLENGEFHRFSAEAIIDTTVWMAKRQTLFGEHAKSSGAGATMDVLKLVTRSLQHVENQLLLLGRQNSLERVAAFIIEMDQRLQEPDVMV